MTFQCNLFCAFLTLFIGYSTGNNQVVTENNENYFRADYLILNSAFYKYHSERKKFSDAREICENEGAKLFYPETSYEAELVLKEGRTNLSNSTEQNIVEVIVGVYKTKQNNTFLTIDDKVFAPFVAKVKENWAGATCVMMRGIPEVIEFLSYGCDQYSLPFFCKKTQALMKWNKECNMPVLNGSDYLYNNQLKKCYKLHAGETTWKKAAEVCEAELSSLAEVNSQEEADHLLELASKVSTDSGVMCLGFQLKSDGWRTLSRKMLRESGYPMWAHTQPDGCGKEKCGAMAFNGRLHDIHCDNHNDKCIFVCEHNPQFKA